MAELVIKIDCGTDKCMNCNYLICESAKRYCEIFSVYAETTASGTYRLEACKKAEIKELR